MAAFSALYPLVRLYIKMAPEATMDTAIRHACREFCRRTWWFQRTILVQTIVGTAYYDLDSGNAEDEILGVRAVENPVTHCPLYPVSQEMVRFMEGKPRWYMFQPPDTLEINPYPSATETDLPELRVRIALQPTMVSSVLPDEVLREHDQAISDGAIAYLAGLPLEAWSNDKLATIYRQSFNEKMRVAKSDQMFSKAARDQSIELQAFNV